MGRLLLFGTIVLARVLSAQAPDQVSNAAETITASDIARHVGVIADDSMMGRHTPSPGLEKTARYVADQFRSAGLGTWIQRYRSPTTLDAARSRLVLAAAGTQAAADLATGARPLSPMPSRPPAAAGVLLLSGRHTTASLARVDARGKTIVYVVPANPNPATQKDVAEWLASTGSGVVIVGGPKDGGFADRLEGALRRERRAAAVAVLGGPTEQQRRAATAWAVYLRPEAVPGFAPVLAADSVDLGRAVADAAPAARALRSATVSLTPQFDRPLNDTTTVPNVIGIVKGSDPVLKDEYVVISAHMDSRGVAPGGADSIHNGADDNASGVAGLIALAKAFSRPGAQPARSLLLLATSGGARDFSGSQYFKSWYELSSLVGAGVLHRVGGDGSEPLDISYIAANVTIDMIGGGGDSVVVDGLREVALPMPPTWIAAAHLELRLAVLEGGSLFFPESDHFAFAVGRVPSLYFHAGSHGDGFQAPDTSDMPRAVDAELAARITRLVFYTTHGIAEAVEPMRWTSEGRRARLNYIEP